MNAITNHIIFDSYPSFARGRFQLTLGKAYPLREVDHSLRLMQAVDDDGQLFNVSLFGRSLTNGGIWHLLEDEPRIRSLDAA